MMSEIFNGTGTCCLSVKMLGAKLCVAGAQYPFQSVSLSQLHGGLQGVHTRRPAVVCGALQHGDYHRSGWAGPGFAHEHPRDWAGPGAARCGLSPAGKGTFTPSVLLHYAENDASQIMKA